MDFDFKVKIELGKYLFLENNTRKRREVINLFAIGTNKASSINCELGIKSFEKLAYPREGNFLKKLASMSIKRQAKIIDYKFGENIYENYPIQIQTEEDLIHFIKDVNQFYKQDALPFFNYWQDVRDFIPFIETTDDNLLKFFGPNTILRKMVVWKMCSHPGYEEYVKYRVDRVVNA